MNNKNIILVFFLLIVPLVLLVVCYRNYVNNYCNNNIKCLKERLENNLTELKNKYSYDVNNYNNDHNNDNEPVVEGFIDGISNWFSNSNNATPLPPVSSFALNTPTTYSNVPLISTTFPPKDLGPNKDNEFKDADNKELLNSLEKRPNNIVPLNTVVKPSNNINNAIHLNPIIKPPIDMNIKETMDNSSPANPPPPPNSLSKFAQQRQNDNSEKIELKSLLKKCQFHHDKCPDKHTPLGNFSIEGIGSHSILNCGNVKDTKPVKAIAIVKNNSLYDIHIIDHGHGFDKNKPPNVTIEGGKGNGATAEAVVDDDGRVKIIKIIHPGYNYSETPNVIVDPPLMNSSCHLCCDFN